MIICLSYLNQKYTYHAKNSQLSVIVAAFLVGPKLMAQAARISNLS